MGTIGHALRPSSGSTGIKLNAIISRFVSVKTELSCVPSMLVGRPKSKSPARTTANSANCMSTPPQATAASSKRVPARSCQQVPPRAVYVDLRQTQPVAQHQECVAQLVQ